MCWVFTRSTVQEALLQQLPVPVGPAGAHRSDQPAPPLPPRPSQRLLSAGELATRLQTQTSGKYLLYITVWYTGSVLFFIISFFICSFFI